MISLTDQENESCENQIFCYICKKGLTNDNKSQRSLSFNRKMQRGCS